MLAVVKFPRLANWVDAAVAKASEGKKQAALFGALGREKSLPGRESGEKEGWCAVPGACMPSGVKHDACPHEHRSLLAEIDESATKKLALPAVLILIFVGMALQAKLDQLVDQIGIGNAGRRPQFGIHAD